MTTRFRSLMLAAAVAILPVGCGTSAPTGVEIAPTDLDALRRAPVVTRSLPASAEGDECRAASIEIVLEGSDLVGYPAGDRYRATVLDTFGFVVTDPACEKLSWEVQGASSGAVVTVTPDGTRHATVRGDGSPYKVSATAPNGVGGSTVLGGAAR